MLRNEAAVARARARKVASRAPAMPEIAAWNMAIAGALDRAATLVDRMSDSEGGRLDLDSETHALDLVAEIYRRVGRQVCADAAGLDAFLLDGGWSLAHLQPLTRDRSARRRRITT